MYKLQFCLWNQVHWCLVCQICCYFKVDHTNQWPLWIETYSVSDLSQPQSVNERNILFLGQCQLLLNYLARGTKLLNCWCAGWNWQRGSSCHILWVKSEWDVASKQRPDPSAATWQHTDNRDGGSNSPSAFLSFPNFSRKDQRSPKPTQALKSVFILLIYYFKRCDSFMKRGWFPFRVGT